MRTNLTPAIVGLVGVLVGGIITAGSSYLLMLRQEAVARETAELNRTLEFRTAARLVELELAAARLAVDVFVEEGRWSSNEFPMEAWQSEKVVLARELPFADWVDVQTAVFAAESFRVLHETLRQGSGIPDEIAASGKNMLTEIETGIAALQRYEFDGGFVLGH